MRLSQLYLASRATTLSVVCLVALALVVSFALTLGGNDLITSLLIGVAPVGLSAVIGVSMGSPFGEVERVASASVARLRLTQIVLLLLVTVLAIGAGSAVSSTSDHLEALIRNCAGYAGLTLLGAFLLGAPASWVPALAYGVGVLILEATGIWSDQWWIWPALPSSNTPASVIAALLLVAGAAVVTLNGARDSLSDIA